MTQAELMQKIMNQDQPKELYGYFWDKGWEPAAPIAVYIHDTNYLETKLLSSGHPQHPQGRHTGHWLKTNFERAITAGTRISPMTREEVVLLKIFLDVE